MLKTQKQRTTQTLVRGFKDRRFEVRVEPAEREFRATSPHVSAREEEERTRTKRCRSSNQASKVERLMNK